MAENNENVDKNLFDGNQTWHRLTNNTLIVGTSGKGKSVLLQQYALAKGISYDEALAQSQPSEDQINAEKAVEELELSMRAVRMQATKNAFWESSLIDSNEFYVFHDSLIVLCGIQSPSDSQLKALFDLLPGGVFGRGIQWGFGDTEVRDEIWTYVEKNVELVKSKCVLPN